MPSKSKSIIGSTSLLNDIMGQVQELPVSRRVSIILEKEANDKSIYMLYGEETYVEIVNNIIDMMINKARRQNPFYKIQANQSYGY